MREFPTPVARVPSDGHGEQLRVMPNVGGSNDADVEVPGDRMQSAHLTYRRMQTATASPGELIALLYDALLRNLSKAERGLGAHDIDEAHAAMLRAQDIVLELISSLDTDADGDAGSIARQLAPLYEYLYRRLLDASLHKETEPLAEVRRLVQPVREAWAHALEQLALEAATSRTVREEGRRG